MTYERNSFDNNTKESSYILKASADGMVYISFSVLTDTNSDFGQVIARISKNSDILAEDGSAYAPTAYNYVLGASVSIMIPIKKDETLVCFWRSSKVGGKYVTLNIIGFGCEIIIV